MPQLVLAHLCHAKSPKTQQFRCPFRARKVLNVCPDVLTLEGTYPDGAIAAGAKLNIEVCHANHCEKSEVSAGMFESGGASTSIRAGNNPWAEVTIWRGEDRVTVGFWPNPLDSFNAGDRFSFALTTSDQTVVVAVAKVVDYEPFEIGCEHCQRAVPRE